MHQRFQSRMDCAVEVEAAAALSGAVQLPVVVVDEEGEQTWSKRRNGGGGGRERFRVRRGSRWRSLNHLGRVEDGGRRLLVLSVLPLSHSHSHSHWPHERQAAATFQKYPEEEQTTRSWSWWLKPDQLQAGKTPSSVDVGRNKRC